MPMTSKYRDSLNGHQYPPGYDIIPLFISMFENWLKRSFDRHHRRRSS